MNDKMLKLGIDEFTLTIFPKEKEIISKWINTASSIIEHFSTTTKIESILNGKLEEMRHNKLQGYTTAYNLGSKDYYFCIAYNENHPDMGVCVRFSAKAWALYQSAYKLIYSNSILLSDFLKQIVINNNYIVRLTRIDLTADYFNYPLNLSILYNQIVNKDILIQNSSGRCTVKNISFFGKNEKVETIYIGSRASNSKGFLRIYDKRKEQLSTNGFRIKEAIECENWVRFEAVFKGKYAHIISDFMINSPINQSNLISFIAQLITEKYRLYENKVNDYLFCTKELLEISNGNKNGLLRCESPRDTSLTQNISHIRCGSGLYPTLFKIENLYGNEKVTSFISYLFTDYKSGSWKTKSMIKELNLWLEKHNDLKNITLEDNY